MRPGASESDVSSLDLLLDTICNMFGGILLMAILVVVLTQTSASQLSKPEHRHVEETLDARALRQEVLTSEGEVVNLKIKASLVLANYEARVSPAVDIMLLRREEMQNAFKKATRHLDDTRKHVSNEAAFLTTASAQEADLARVLSATEAEHADLVELLRFPVHLRGQVRLPHQRGAIAGQAEYFIVKGRKAYYVGYRHRGHAHLHVEDITDLTLPRIRAIYDQPIRIQPKETAGFPVPENVEQSAPWRERLSRYRADEHYFVFFVWNDSDSFTTFQRLKNSALARKFHYVVRIQVPESGAITVEPARFHESE